MSIIGEMMKFDILLVILYPRIETSAVMVCAEY